MGSDAETKGPGFTIVDKRGQADEPAEQETPAQPRERALPSVDFSTFVISLGTSALYHMGLVPDPQTGKPVEANLPVARQTIDTVEMLEEKTQGNLSEDEAALIKHLLTELRMRYLEASK
jgi:hypothetical protein